MLFLVRSPWAIWPKSDDFNYSTPLLVFLTCSKLGTTPHFGNNYHSPVCRLDWSRLALAVSVLSDSTLSPIHLFFSLVWFLFPFNTPHNECNGVTYYNTILEGNAEWFLSSFIQPGWQKRMISGWCLLKSQPSQKVVNFFCISIKTTFRGRHLSIPG